jgi:hypothetical protein
MATRDFEHIERLLDGMQTDIGKQVRQLLQSVNTQISEFKQEMNLVKLKIAYREGVARTKGGRRLEGSDCGERPTSFFPTMSYGQPRF